MGNARSFVPIVLPGDPGSPSHAATKNYVDNGLSGKQPASADLSTIAGISSATAGALVTDGSGWIRKTYAQLKTALGLVASDVGLGNVDNTSDSTKNSATATLTNKRFVKRVGSTASTATLTFDTDSYDQYNLTAQAAALSIANPSGTPTDGQPITIRIKDNGTARAISFGTQWRAFSVTMPTTTVVNKTLYISGFWNAADSKVDVLAAGPET